MKAFLITLIVLFVIEMVGKAIWLVGAPPPRSRAGVAGDVVALALLLAWASVLLVEVA